MDETFEVQTIGRIRRMSEVKHYEKDILDSCYLYMLDDKFTEGVKKALSKGALDAEWLELKSEHKKFTLKSEQQSGLTEQADNLVVLNAIANYFERNYKISFFQTKQILLTKKSQKQIPPF